MLPTLLTRGLGLLLLPIYARAFAPADYGALDLISTAGPVLHVVLCLEILQGYVRNRVDVPESDRPSFTGTAWTFSLGIYVVAVFVALPFSGHIAKAFLGSPDLKWAVAAGIVSLSAQNIMNMVISQFRWELRSREYSVFASVFALLSISTAAYLALYLDTGISGVLWGQAGSAALVGTGAILRLRGSWRIAFDPEALSAMLRFSLPLVPASLAVFTSLYVSRWSLNGFATTHDVGIYGMAARIASVVTLITAAIQNTATPLIYERYKEESTPKELASIFTLVAGLSLTVCLTLHLFGSDLVHLIATPAYESSGALVGILALALIVNQLYAFTPGIAIAKRTGQQFWVTLFAAVVGVLANFILVPTWGALGAAVATLVSASVFCVTWAVVSHRHYPIPFEYKALSRLLLLFSIAFAAPLVVSHVLPLTVLNGHATKVAILVGFILLAMKPALLGLASRSGSPGR